MSLSTAEVEYRAATMVAQENIWLTQLMKDLHEPINYAVELYCDNQLAICIAENLVCHTRTKYVEVHYHFVREKVLKVEIDLETR